MLAIHGIAVSGTRSSPPNHLQDGKAMSVYTSVCCFEAVIVPPCSHNGGAVKSDGEGGCRQSAQETGGARRGGRAVRRYLRCYTRLSYTLGVSDVGDYARPSGCVEKSGCAAVRDTLTAV